MLNLKKTAVAVLALGSSAVFAGTMGPVCVPGSVTVPCETNAWGVGIYALYLEPNYSAPLSHIAAFSTGAGTDFVELDPRWSWGFKLEGAYYFSTGNDLNLNWYHVRRSTTRSFAGVVDVDNALLGVDGTAAISAVHDFEPEWDAVNLEFGQRVNFGERDVIRFHGGVQYTRIHRDGTLTVTEVGATTGDIGGLTFGTGSVSTDVKFDGFGPRIGADMSYNLGNGFGIYANGAAALLIGRHNVDLFYTPTAAGTFVPTPFGFTAVNDSSHNAMSPELEAKLGIKYDFAMAQGDLTIDLGYMWVNYFNAQSFVYNGTEMHSADFSLHGPYLGIKWAGIV